MLKTTVVTEISQTNNNQKTDHTTIEPDPKQNTIETIKEKEKLIQFSDFLPIIKSCLIAIICVIFLSFGTIFVLYKISPENNTINPNNISQEILLNH